MELENNNIQVEYQEQQAYSSFDNNNLNDGNNKHKLTKAEKKLLKKERKQKIKANKKYIHNRTLNKSIPKQTQLASDICIEAQDAWKIVAFEDKRYDLIKGANLKIYKSDFMMIFGESGSGKTTLLSLLSALDRPSEGNVNILSYNTACLKFNQLVKLRNKFIGYIFQQYGLLKEVSVIENIIITLGAKEQHKILRLSRKYRSIEKKNQKKFNKIIIKNNKRFLNKVDFSIDFVIENELRYFAIWYYMEPINFDLLYFVNLANKLSHQMKLELKRARDHLFTGLFVYEIMKKLEIDHLINYKVNALSGGQQQRVSISRAVAKKPQILFADEPTGAVDAKTAKIIMEIFKWLNHELSTTIIIVTHNNNLIDLSNHIVFLDNGYIVGDYINENVKNIDEINFE